MLVTYYAVIYIPSIDSSLVRCAHSWAIELNILREIPYLRSHMYYLSRYALQFTFSFALNNCGAEVFKFNFSLFMDIQPLKREKYCL